MDCTYKAKELAVELSSFTSASTRLYNEAVNSQAVTALKPPCSAGTGRTSVFSQLSAAVVRRKANDGVVYAIRAWFKYDTALSAVV